MWYTVHKKQYEVVFRHVRYPDLGVGVPKTGSENKPHGRRIYKSNQTVAGTENQDDSGGGVYEIGSASPTRRFYIISE